MTSEQILNYFKEITTIPRESGHEAPMTYYLERFASSHNLPCKKDSTGNILITKVASPGYENVPTIVLQSHQDMVCEKRSGVDHDFSKDPIKYVVEDGWMIAPDTTLGADDGIGIAAQLAVLVSDKPMGKVECLFTISEETGMDGAENLEMGFFTGNTLINLDSEDEGQIFIGCAGGINTSIQYKASFESNPYINTLRLSIGGAIGGHSGDDINKERVNTVQQMSRFLYGALKGDLRLVSINGGGKRNAIARDCEAIVSCTRPEEVKKAFLEFGSILKSEYAVSDPGIFSSVEEIANASIVVRQEDASKLVGAMFACPHGVLAMSQDIKDFVETSTNLASIRTGDDGCFTLETSQRSSTMSEREMAASKVEAVFSLIGAEIKHNCPYPGWKPNMESKILRSSVESYRRLFNTEPLVLAIHAGLECGLFLEKFPHLDMISIGPTLRGVHAPGERMELKSLDKFVALLEDILLNYK